MMSRRAFHYAGESHKCSDGRSLIFSTTEKGSSESSNEKKWMANKKERQVDQA